MGGSAAARRKAWAIASLGALGALVLGALVPGAAPAGASPTSRPREPVDPDVHAADDDSNGQFQSCRAYYGFGKSWAHVQVTVDDEVDDDITFPDDYELVLSGDLDPSTPGTERCVPERLTQADWDTNFPGLAPSYGSIVPLPPGDNIVIPGQFSNTGVTGSPLRLRFDGDFDDLRIEQDTATVPNFHDGAAYDAEYAAYLVDVIGQPGASAFQQPCTVNPPSPAQQDAANAAFAAMDPAFQTVFQNFGTGPPFSTCFPISNLQQFFRDYWFPYAWGNENPVTFELDPTPPEASTATPATPITPSAITFTG